MLSGPASGIRHIFLPFDCYLRTATSGLKYSGGRNHTFCPEIGLVNEIDTPISATTAHEQRMVYLWRLTFTSQ